MNCTLSLTHCILFLPLIIARTDRYNHEYVSDEEDGGEPGREEKFEKVFSNFTSTAPRMSVYLDEQFKYVQYMHACTCIIRC